MVEAGVRFDPDKETEAFFWASDMVVWKEVLSVLIDVRDNIATLNENFSQKKPAKAAKKPKAKTKTKLNK